MLKQNINHRQAEESAPQQFESPQDEMAHVKATDRTLKGFIRCLKVIRQAKAAETHRPPFFEFSQPDGRLDADWLRAHRETCAACAGALLAWFFGEKTDLVRNGSFWSWNFCTGFRLLDRHLGFACADEGCNVHPYHRKSTLLLSDIIHELSGDPDWDPRWRQETGKTAGGANAWPVPHLAVFRKLAAMYPDR